MWRAGVLRHLEEAFQRRHGLTGMICEFLFLVTIPNSATFQVSENIIIYQDMWDRDI